VISSVVLFGATGDLAERHLFPALAALEAAGRLPDDFHVLGAARPDWDDETFRRHIQGCLAEHAADVPDAARTTVTRALRYRPVDLVDADSVAGVLRARDGEGPVAAYLALPPKLFAPTVRGLAAAGLPSGSRVVIEKPFGENLEEARELNALLIELFGDATEDVVFRVDHVLAMASVRRLLDLRLGSAVLETLWDSRRIDEVQILWEEDLALEGRAGYYDATGALKDVMQNHMLQLLAILTMEPCRRADAGDLRERKAEALAAVRAPRSDEMRDCTRRARYTAGSTGERDIPAYADEDGVDPARETETLAEVVLRVDTPRWRDTRFVLRAGKALAQRRKQVVVRFGARDADAIRIGIDGPLDLRLRFTGAGATQVVLAGPPADADLPPYAHVLLDVLAGGTSLSVRGDGAEAAWRVMTPVLDAWAGGQVPLEEYPAGSAGLAPRN
jgi:glucose-6-phosphate 1-dehydrogenase